MGKSGSKNGKLHIKAEIISKSISMITQYWLRDDLALSMYAYISILNVGLRLYLLESQTAPHLLSGDKVHANWNQLKATKRDLKATKKQLKNY